MSRRAAALLGCSPTAASTSASGAPTTAPRGSSATGAPAATASSAAASSCVSAPGASACAAGSCCQMGGWYIDVKAMLTASSAMASSCVSAPGAARAQWLHSIWVGQGCNFFIEEKTPSF